MGGAKHRRGRGIEGINVTPMVDIMLVLLIVYIVASELPRGAVQVDLPQSSAAGDQTPTDAAKGLTLTVSLDAKGQIRIADQEVSRAEFHNRLAQIPVEQRRQVELAVDRSVSHGEVIELMELLRSYAIEELSFVTLRSAMKPGSP